MKIEFIPVMERAKNYPPAPIKSDIPDWYKETSPIYDPASMTAEGKIKNSVKSPFTIKKCVPVMDYMTSGYYLYSHVDIMFSQQEKTDPKNFYWYTPSTEDLSSIFGMHSFDQCPVSFEGANRHYIKFLSGWKIRTPKGYSCLFYQNFYAQENRFKLFPAIVDTDVYDDQIGFPGYISYGKKDFTVNAGTPIMVIFPFKRDDWKMEVKNEIENGETKIGVRIKQHFENAYRNFFHVRKNYDK